MPRVLRRGCIAQPESISVYLYYKKRDEAGFGACGIDVGQEKEKRCQVEQHDPACHDECGEGNIQKEMQRHTFDGGLPNLIRGAVNSARCPS
mgnify:CR=1 FL=1